MFDMPHKELSYTGEIERRFHECMRNNIPARDGYDAAHASGLDENLRLKAAIINLTEMNDRAMSIIEDAVSRGVPITKEIVAVRSRLSGSQHNWKAF